MSAPVGFDPGALLQLSDGTKELVEVTLWQRDDGTWSIAIEHADERSDELTLSRESMSDFAAPAREAAA